MKKKNGDYKYTFIFLICIVASSVLCLLMILGDKPSGNDRIQEEPSYIDRGKEYRYDPDGEDEIVILNETDIKKMVEKKLAEDFPLRNIGISLKETQKAYLTGTINRDELREYIEKTGAKLDPYIEMALSVLPKTISISAEFDVGMSEDGGLIVLTSRKIEAAGAALPEGMLPQEFFDGLNESINRALVESGYLFQSIRIGEGYIELIP